MFSSKHSEELQWSESLDSADNLLSMFGLRLEKQWKRCTENFVDTFECESTSDSEGSHNSTNTRTNTSQRNKKQRGPSADDKLRSFVGKLCVKNQNKSFSCHFLSSAPEKLITEAVRQLAAVQSLDMTNSPSYNDEASAQSSFSHTVDEPLDVEAKTGSFVTVSETRQPIFLDLTGEETVSDTTVGGFSIYPKALSQDSAKTAKKNAKSNASSAKNRDRVISDPINGISTISKYSAYEKVTDPAMATAVLPNAIRDSLGQITTLQQKGGLLRKAKKLDGVESIESSDANLEDSSNFVNEKSSAESAEQSETATSHVMEMINAQKPKPKSLPNTKEQRTKPSPNPRDVVVKPSSHQSKGDSTPKSTKNKAKKKSKPNAPVSKSVDRPSHHSHGIHPSGSIVTMSRPAPALRLPLVTAFAQPRYMASPLPHVIPMPFDLQNVPSRSVPNLPASSGHISRVFDDRLIDESSTIVRQETDFPSPIKRDAYSQVSYSSPISPLSGLPHNFGYQAVAYVNRQDPTQYDSYQRSLIYGMSQSADRGNCVHGPHSGMNSRFQNHYPQYDSRHHQWLDETNYRNGGHSSQPADSVRTPVWGRPEDSTNSNHDAPENSSQPLSSANRSERSEDRGSRGTQALTSFTQALLNVQNEQSRNERR